MWTIIATVLAQVLPALLTAFWARQDVTDAAKLRVYEAMQRATDAAGEWKNAAWADPARAATLGVLPGSQGLRPYDPHDPPP